MTDDPRLLRDELHDLAGDVGSTSIAKARARDRARRGIARHRRNQRAAVAGLATAALAVAVTAAVALGRDSHHAAPPAGRTTVVSATTTIVAPTVGAPTTTATVPRPGTITIAARPHLPAAISYSIQHFAWGRGLDQLAYSVPQGEGASGGPAAFTVDPSKNTDFFDFSNSRILFHSGRAAPSAQHLNFPSAAVTAAVFDDEGSAIAALPGELVVFGTANRQSTFPYAGPEITRLASYGKTVYSVAQDGGLQPLLHRVDRTTYAAGGSLDEPTAVTVTVGTDRHTATIQVPSTGEHYDVQSTDPIGGVPAAVRLANGDVDFVLAPVYRGTDLDEPQVYVLGHIPERGLPRFATVQATQGYLVNGPVWQINDIGIAVMESTTGYGVQVSWPLAQGAWP